MGVDEQAVPMDGVVYVVDSMYDVVCGVEDETFLYPLLLILWYLVAHTYLVAVPPPSCVGEIQGTAEIGVQHRFVFNAERVYIVLIPNVLAVPFRLWTAVRTGCCYGYEFA